MACPLRPASAGPRVSVLLIMTGLATALPLLLFGAAATRIPLSTIGLLQYITPTMQFLIGVLIYDELGVYEGEQLGTPCDF